MRNKLFVILFLGILYSSFFINIFKSADELSYSERRKLAQFPEFNLKNMLDASFMKGFDDYAVDQAAFREPFRSLKAAFDLNIMRRSDNNGIFVINDMVFKTEYPINESSVSRMCSRINYVYEKYLSGMNVYFSMIPDKNYYIKNPQHLIIDYNLFESIVLNGIDKQIKYISLFDSLSLDCYFKTDSHWRQDKLEPVISALGTGLGIDMNFDINNYQRESYSPFYGVYYGQSALSIRPDELVYLVNAATQNAEIISIETESTSLPVYDVSKLGSMDSYDVFLLGPSSVITVRNPENTSGRELIIFRDSFASSLAPLLLEGYSSVTLIDLRYIHPDVLDRFVDFNNQDVLFLYSSTIINNSAVIR